MRFLILLALLSVISITYADDDSVPLPYDDPENALFLPISPSELMDSLFINDLNLGARNLTLDAIEKGHIPSGTYHISNVFSAEFYRYVEGTFEEVNDYGYNTAYNDGGFGPRMYTRFVVEITNGEGSGLYANFTIYVSYEEGKEGVIHPYYIARYSYTWYTNEAEGDFEDNEFEFVLEHSWSEFSWGEEAEIEADAVGNESDATDDTEVDDVVIIVQSDAETGEEKIEWGDLDTDTEEPLQ